MAGPFTNTLHVWHAIFLRETLDRLFGMRAAWVWLLVEPAIHIAFISMVWGVLRQRTIAGADVIVWIIVGMLAFFLFRRTAIQVMHSIDCNKAFFAFRQVRPFDTAFIRAGVECFVMTFISLLILAVAAFLGRAALPADPLLVLWALGGLWVFGLGYGLVASVSMRLIPETKHILHLLMVPLYLISGVILPIASIPLPYRDWLMWNPLVHGLEVVRGAFFHTYYPVPGVNLGYLFMCALCSLALGLALYRRFEVRLVMQ